MLKHCPTPNQSCPKRHRQRSHRNSQSHWKTQLHQSQQFSYHRHQQSPRRHPTQKRNLLSRHHLHHSNTLDHAYGRIYVTGNPRNFTFQTLFLYRYQRATGRTPVSLPGTQGPPFRTRGWDPGHWGYSPSNRAAPCPALLGHFDGDRVSHIFKDVQRVLEPPDAPHFFTAGYLVG